MGTITETSTFDETVYQWETTDPVLGGPSGIANQPLKNLTNRSRWLKDQVTALLQAIGLLAPIDSPTFTGAPKAPTPAATATGTEIVTAAFARSLNAGVAVISMTGDTTVTATQASAKTLELIGTTSVDSFLLFPAGTGVWNISNGTNKRVKCRLASGGGFVTVAPGYQKVVWTDGSTFVAALTDFESVRLAGSSTVNSPALTDSSEAVTNTYWVRTLIAAEQDARANGDQNVLNTVAAGYVSRNLAQAGNVRGNFTPGAGFDVPVALDFTTGPLGGRVLFIASLCHTFQTPNVTYLRMYVNGNMSLEEITYQTKVGMLSFYAPPNTAFHLEIHCVTGSDGGGGWCQMSIAGAYSFNPM